MHGEVMITGNSDKPRCQIESTGTFCASLRHMFQICLLCPNEVLLIQRHSACVSPCEMSILFGHSLRTHLSVAWMFAV